MTRALSQPVATTASTEVDDVRGPARTSALLGAILVTHRYLAIGVGLLMTLWCLSGFVMMYQGYPQLTEAERIKGLAPLQLANCCNVAELPFADDVQAPDVRIEMLLGAPVLRIAAPRSPARTFDLRTGLATPELDAAQALEVAREYGLRHALGGAPRLVGTVDIDQWTIQSARRHQPLYLVAFDDRAASEIYVSGLTGEVIQDTNRRERVLSWLGAVPHWLYPTKLRQNGPLWSDIVIYTSLVGTFLAITGLYVGIARFRRRCDGRWGSPFRGWWYWHHIGGLIFGVLTLTWVFSGLMTMNPWGALVGGGASDHVRTIRGEATWAEAKKLLGSAAALPEHEFVQLTSAPFDGRFHALAVGADGTRARLDVTGSTVAPLRHAEIDEAVAKLGVAVAESVLLENEDGYYYGHKSEVDLPVYRVILGDEQRTRLYIHPLTGRTRGVDATMRTARWIRFGLHDFDFAGLRVRPIWDVVVLLLLAGVTAVCITGTWLAWKRVRLDFRRLRRTLQSR